MPGFNLSALAVRERAITLFFIFASACAGFYAYFHLGRAEDPSFTIKVLTVSAVWPGATAQEMQDLVAEPLEIRLQELRWYDRVETITRPGLALMTLQLIDKTPPKEVADQFYQARKKLGDEARKLPQGAIGPFVNDEYSDVSFALYSVEAPGFPLRKLTRVAEELRQSFLHVPGVQKVDIVGEQQERIFVQFSYSRLTMGHFASGYLFGSLATECGHSCRVGGYGWRTGVCPPRRGIHRHRDPAIPRSRPASKLSSCRISRRSREATRIRQLLPFGTMESPPCC